MVELQIEFFYVFRLFFNDKMRSLEVKTGMWKFIHAKYIDSQLYWKHPRKKFPPISFYKNHDSLGMGSKFYANFQCDIYTPLVRMCGQERKTLTVTDGRTERRNIGLKSRASVTKNVTH